MASLFRLDSVHRLKKRRPAAATKHRESIPVGINPVKQVLFQLLNCLCGSRMTTLNDKQMKKWRAVAGLNVILGGIVLMVQVATLFTLYEWVDWIGIGIWGGCFMISAGSLTIQRNPRLISMSICAMLSGLALIIFYAWNLGVYNNYSGYYNDNYYHPYCAYYSYYGQLCEWRLASDITFIVCGSLAMMVNLVLSMNAKAIVIVRPIVRYPVNNVNAYPMSTTNTTYVVTSSAAYPMANQQTVYQVPIVNYSNNTTNGVIYQTTSPAGYPPMNNQQQQPVYYTQTNPPAYTTTAIY